MAKFAAELELVVAVNPVHYIAEVKGIGDATLRLVVVVVNPPAGIGVVDVEVEEERCGERLDHVEAVVPDQPPEASLVHESGGEGGSQGAAVAPGVGDAVAQRARAGKAGFAVVDKVALDLPVGVIVGGVESVLGVENIVEAARRQVLNDARTGIEAQAAGVEAVAET